MKFFVSSIVASWVGLAYSHRMRSASRNPEVLEPFIDHNFAPLRVDLREAKIGGISPFVWMKNEESLIASAESRFVGSSTIGSSADFIESEFRSLGFDVTVDPFPSPVEGAPLARNILGRLIGASSESILVGAHYDDLPASGSAPGADDNASGVATMMSIAQNLSGVKLKRNVIFAAFSGEEQGVVGSTHFAQHLAPSLNIVSAIVLDQDGNPGTTHGLIFESVGRSKENQRIIDTLADSVDSEISSVEVNYNGFGSDHVALSKAGIPSVLVIERNNMELAEQYGHTAKDAIGNIDMGFGGAIARTVQQAVVSLAMA